MYIKWAILCINLMVLILNFSTKTFFLPYQNFKLLIKNSKLRNGYKQFLCSINRNLNSKLRNVYIQFLCSINRNLNSKLRNVYKHLLVMFWCSRYGMSSSTDKEQIRTASLPIMMGLEFPHHFLNLIINERAH